MLQSCRANLLQRTLISNSPFQRQAILCRTYVQSLNAFPRVVAAGEVQPNTPLPPLPLAWYRQPQFFRNLVNILLLASFVNTTAMVLGYKSQKKEMELEAKLRIQTLEETIEKVRKGKEVNIRTALGTSKQNVEQSWTERMSWGMLNWLMHGSVLEDIEEEDLIWKTSSEEGPQKSKPA
jgi:Family of unknown function (DUF5321)